MGVIYKTFTFDNVSSDTYDVYLTAEGVFDAPERSVEMISIPGRSGDYALDQGKFNNITVTYKAGIFGADESTFASKMTAFRNWICSKKGYVRLTDEYNPNEYRMAVYKSGLEVDPAQLVAGEFTLEFECKPQRWLTSGESSQTIANNGTLTNPTLFDSYPILQPSGYGKISFNGYTITLENVVFGHVVIGGNVSSESIAVPIQYFNNGDELTISGIGASVPDYIASEIASVSVTSQSVTKNNADVSSYTMTPGKAWDNVWVLTNLTAQNLTFTAGTTGDLTFNASVKVTKKDGTVSNRSHAAVIEYNGHDDFAYKWTSTYINTFRDDRPMWWGDITAESTANILGVGTKIDCDTGECYRVINGETLNLNGYVSLGADLPTLSPGTNTFTYDNTITSLSVRPRWWQV